MERTEVSRPKVARSAMRRYALIAGFSLLVLATLAGLANFGAIEALVTEGDAAQTARDIQASEGRFRLAIAALVVVAVLDAVVAWALFEFFRGVHEGAARIMAWLRLGQAAVFGAAIGLLPGVLRLLPDDEAGALHRVEEFRDVWDVGLVFFGLHLIVLGYLAYRSGFVPRFIGILLVIAGLGYLLDTFGAILFAGYTVEVSVVTFVGEIAIMIWLLVKGWRPDRVPAA